VKIRYACPSPNIDPYFTLFICFFRTIFMAMDAQNASLQYLFEFHRQRKYEEEAQKG
jgi:hypothetical protein